MAGARVAVRPKMAMPAARLDGGSFTITKVIAIGISAPPVKPCSMRNTIMLGKFQAAPHSVENSRNSAVVPIIYARRLNTRVNSAVSGMTMISATR